MEPYVWLGIYVSMVCLRPQYTLCKHLVDIAVSALVRVGKVSRFRGKCLPIDAQSEQPVLDAHCHRCRDATLHRIKRAKLGLQAQNHAAAIKLQAERKAGMLLQGLERAAPKPGPGRGKKTVSNAGHGFTASSPYANALAEAGASRQDANRWQRTATLPEEDFEQLVTDLQDAGQELTTSKVLREVAKREREERKNKVKDTPFPDGETDLYRIVYADPPWSYGDSGVVAVATCRWSAFNCFICHRPKKTRPAISTS